MISFSGGKFTASHTSIINAAKKPVAAAAALDCVKKISLGIIKPIGNGLTSLKFLDDSPGCLLVKIRGPRSIQEIRFYTTNKELVQEVLEKTLLQV